jgi:hypothetical protein
LPRISLFCDSILLLMFLIFPDTEKFEKLEKLLFAK